MPMRPLVLVGTLAVLTVPCAAQVSSTPWGRPVPRPLTQSLLTTTTFLVVTDLWAVLAAPDTLRFCTDGTTENRRAGLTGTWRLENDTTVWIAGRRFQLRSEDGDLFSPVTAGAALGWSVRLPPADFGAALTHDRHLKVAEPGPADSLRERSRAAPCSSSPGP